MKNGARMAAGAASALLAALGVTCVALRIPAGAGRQAAVAAAGFIIPQGNYRNFFSGESDGTPSLTETERPNKPASSRANSSELEGSSRTAESSSLPSENESSSSLPGTVSTSNGKILELYIGNTGTEAGGIWIKNSTQHHSTLDFAKELLQLPAVHIKKDGKPQVLIYHTHTTEAFLGDTRTTDKSRSVCAVGEEIASQLTAASLGVAHDTTYHDYPAYNGSYDRSKVTIQNDLKKYPGIQVTLDIHRDAMHRTDGTKLKPTAVINGKKAAQIMIICGCDDTGSLAFPDWEYNLRLGLRLQKALTDNYPGLARPVDFCARRYNENLTKGSLLIEVGTDANTLDEAKYSGRLLGKALALVLNGLTN